MVNGSASVPLPAGGVRAIVAATIGLAKGFGYATGEMTDGTPAQPRQRWQIRFSRAGPALPLRQEEVVAAFETAFRESGLPLSETQGKRSRARLALAANLPAGMEAEAEVLEAFFDEMIPVERVRAAGDLLPEGVRIVEARDVWHGFPSAASQVRAAEYTVHVASEERVTEERVRDAVAALLAARRLPGRRRRSETERRADEGERDLRPLVQDVEVAAVEPGGGSAELAMVLRAGPSLSARPEDVVAALELPLRVVRVVRRRLRFVDTPPVGR